MGKMYIKKENENMAGGTHGGIIAALADTSMGFAFLTLGFKVVTMEMNINFLKPANIGDDLLAYDVVIHAGKSTVVAETTINSCDKKLVAKSGGIFCH